ncbi:MAG: HAD family phosphatase [Dehalococcoidales bacterium]|nr:HAD family phosphatase [Dehalococcoidales bacterium]
MDGTIVDSSDYHRTAWQKTLRNHGVELTEEKFRYAFGRRNDENIRNFIGQHLSQQEVDKIGEEKETAFRDLIKDSIKSFPGAVELIKSLAKAGFQQAIVSSAPLENIRLITRTLNIEGYFKLLISGDDVTKGKPHPQAFLLAAGKLGIEPENCVVMEDAVAGVTAAKAGGMHCIAVTNSNHKGLLSSADIVTDSLEKITAETVEKILDR